MKNVRLNLTNEEKIAQQLIGLDNEHTHFNMNEGNIDDLIAKQKADKFNEEVDTYINEFDEHQKQLMEVSESMGVNPEKLEIKPMQDQLLIKPFAQNPFQKMKVENGIITDAGGFRINVDKNPMTGKFEEQEQVIITGTVIEIGPTVKYIKPGDVIFYHKRDAIPVPFFKQGLWNVPEYRILAVVNESLTERFNEINNGK